MKLYRPTGINELALVYQTGMRAWPPRLAGQPIFYPVLNLAYAEQIARDWNAPSEGRAGFATSFDVDDAYVSRFDVQIVGGRQHEELWVPADVLPEFNAHMSSHVTVETSYFGSEFEGHIPKAGSLRGLDARAQFKALARCLAAGDRTLAEAVLGCRETVFLNFAYWTATAGACPEVDGMASEEILAAIGMLWRRESPQLPLPSGDSHLVGDHS